MNLLCRLTAHPRRVAASLLCLGAFVGVCSSQRDGSEANNTDVAEDVALDVVDEPAAHPFDTQRVVLPNGLTVVMVQDHSQQNVSASLLIKAGSVQDPEGREGTAHLLLHLLLRGSAQLGTTNRELEEPLLAEIHRLSEQLPTARGAERTALSEQMRALSTQAGAHEVPQEFFLLNKELALHHPFHMVSLDHTAFMSTLPPNALEPWLQAQAELLRPPAMRGFQEARDDLAREIGNTAFHTADSDEQRAALFPKHPYGRPTNGTADSLAQLTVGDVEQFWQTWYVPNNAVIVLVGDLDPTEATALVEESFGHFARSEVPEHTLAPVPPNTEAATVRAAWPHRVSLAWPIHGADPFDWATLEVMGAWIEADLAHRKSPVYEVDVRTNRYTHGGTFEVHARCRPKRKSKACMSALHSTITALRTGDITATFNRGLRALSEHDTLRSLTSNSSHAHALRRGLARGQTGAELYEELLLQRTVTAAQVQAAAQRYLSGPAVDERFSAHNYPRFVGSRAMSIRNDSRGLTEHSKLAASILNTPRPALPATWLQEGTDYTHTPDGRVVAVANPHNELFSLSLVYGRGWLDDPHVCQAVRRWRVAATLTEAGAWAEPLQRDGVTLTTSCTAERVVLTLAGTHESAASAVDFLREQLQTPVLARKALARASVPRKEHWKRELMFGPDRGEALPTRAGFKATSDADATASLHVLAATTPDLLWFGPGDAEAVAALFPGERQEARRSVAPVTPSLPRFVIRSPKSRHVPASLWFMRWSEPYDADHEALYEHYITYLGDHEGILSDQLKAAGNPSYSTQTHYQRSAAAQRNLLTGTLLTEKGDLVPAVEATLAILRRTHVVEERWSRVAAATQERVWGDDIPRSDVAWWIHAWQRRGLRTDVREHAWTQVRDLEHSAFEAFVAQEAATTPMFVLRVNPTPEQLARLHFLGEVIDAR